MNKRDIEFLFLLIFPTRKKNKIKSGNKLAERCKRGGERLEKTDLYRVVAAVFRMWIVGSGGSSSNSSRWLHARNANSRNNRAFSLVRGPIIRSQFSLRIFSNSHVDTSFPILPTLNFVSFESLVKKFHGLLIVITIIIIDDEVIVWYFEYIYLWRGIHRGNCCERMGWRFV